MERTIGPCYRCNPAYRIVWSITMYSVSLRNESMMAWERIKRLHRAVDKHPIQSGIYIFLVLEHDKVWPSL
jgi:hypothetical protein